MYEREQKINEAEQQELAAIEAELAAFSPRPSRLDRDRTMFLAGQASVSPEITPSASKSSTRRWAAALTMTAVAGCLLAMVIVQQRSIIALQTNALQTTVASPLEQPQPDQPTPQPVENEPTAEPPTGRAFVDDIQPPGLERRVFDFSDDHLLAWADSGTLTARSFMMTDEARVQAKTNPTPDCDWPKQTYEPSPPLLPYYKLLKQLQAAEM